MRKVKSYILRRSSISLAQEHAWIKNFSQWGITYQESHIDLNKAFGRQQAKILEIGFGMGDSLAQMAKVRPDLDYIGIEVYRPGVAHLLYLMDKEGINNIRVVQHDAVEVITHMFLDNIFSAVHIYFPDPWPKRRHHKRRLIQSSFIALLVRKMKQGAYLHLATDWQHYAEQMLTVLSNEKALRNTTSGFVSRPRYRPFTKFELRGQKEGHAIWDLIFEKI